MSKVMEKGTILSVTLEMVLLRDVTHEEVAEYFDWHAGRTRGIAVGHPLAAMRPVPVTDRVAEWREVGSLADRPNALTRAPEDDDEFDPRHLLAIKDDAPRS